MLCSYKNYIILFRAGRNLHGQMEYAVFEKWAEIIIGGSAQGAGGFPERWDPAGRKAGKRGVRMTIDIKDLLNSILGSMDRIDYIKADDIPAIDLYMDQVTTFMESHLRNTTRNPETDKILTKTMINNYAKNDLLPPPVKKKYSKDHVLLLIFIYYFKGILSINDIQELLRPITDQYFDKTGGMELEQIYREVFGLEDAQKDLLKEDIERKYRTAGETFADAPEEDQDFLHIFSFICMLSFDVYVKKLLIEKMIDGYTEKKKEKEHGKETKKEEN